MDQHTQVLNQHTELLNEILRRLDDRHGPNAGVGGAVPAWARDSNARVQSVNEPVHQSARTPIAHGMPVGQQMPDAPEPPA
ncbi:hypothetical protein HBB16_05225 [Pseudonocardia sp. MCCB 268]|nr:hypothetical protein [Pseudonocardia cytotoxica]